jgi:hypothetical protein
MNDWNNLIGAKTCAALWDVTQQRANQVLRNIAATRGESVCKQIDGRWWVIRRQDAERFRPGKSGPKRKERA